MEHSNRERAALDAALFRLHLDVERSRKDQLLDYLSLLLEKNKRLNLTSVTDFDDAVVLHLEDSLSSYEDFCQETGEFLDLGTGGGLPGIPLAIVSGRSGALLDSVKKKARAVGSFIYELGLEDSLEAVGMRSEDYATDHRNSFQTIVSRAVAPLGVLEELASPLLAPGGTLIAFKGPASKEGEASGVQDPFLLGFELESSRNVVLGDGLYSRVLYRFKKVSEAKIDLPRRAGMAQKHPLL
ncbi:MAG: 16S rRNA (guanine(527)-N(7))-methyltransferase RsmG [Coriobacteriaceae bacterium]|nr:16S rRNA (guanine(527)-N(7))-methyltransferase RsmG [Coriobacteriaceae bacterium]